MKRNIFAGLLTAAMILSLSMVQPIFAAGGSIANNGSVSDSATVSMTVGKFAAIAGLNDFSLSTQDADGNAGSVYSGSSTFRLITNSAVHMILEGSNLVNGTNSVATSYALDGAGTSIETSAGVHNSEHTVSASATLGEISDQEAGAYSGQITVTVSAL